MMNKPCHNRSSPRTEPGIRLGMSQLPTLPPSEQGDDPGVKGSGISHPTGKGFGRGRSSRRFGHLWELFVPSCGREGPWGREVPWVSVGIEPSWSWDNAKGDSDKGL